MPIPLLVDFPMGALTLRVVLIVLLLVETRFSTTLFALWFLNSFLKLLVLAGFRVSCGSRTFPSPTFSFWRGYTLGIWFALPCFVVLFHTHLTPGELPLLLHGHLLRATTPCKPDEEFFLLAFLARGGPGGRPLFSLEFFFSC